VWPKNLAFSYPRWQINAGDPAQYIPVVGCIAAAVALWVWRRKLPLGAIAGVVFFVAALSPMLGFISNYTFLYSFVADHYVYPASAGLIALLAAAIFSEPVKRFLGGAPLATVLSAVLIIVLCGLTWQQAHAYQNIELLWRDTLAKNPESWMAHYNLGLELQAQGKITEAIDHYSAAIDLNPKHAKAESNLGLALATEGKLSGAVQHYEAALRLQPNFAAAHNNLAVALGSQGSWALAVGHLKTALEIEPAASSLGTLLNLGDFLKLQGRNAEAMRSYQKASSLFPSDTDSLRRQAKVYIEQGQLNEAAAVCRDALRIAPERADVLVDLATALVGQTNYDEAITDYRKALQTQPENASFHFNVAAVLSLQGKSEEARWEVAEALRLRPDLEPAQQLSFILSLRRGN
jgi:tetratricopeptide (TPR) repeat protein